MTIADRISSAFDIRKEEQKIVALLLLRSFSIGVVQTLAATVATTLFLEHYSPQELALVYIGSAFVAPLAGVAHYRLTHRMSYTLGASASLGLIFVVMIAFLNVEGLYPNSKILPLIFYVWYFTQETFIYNEFWAQVDRIFNVRQAKRLSGFVATGDVLARITTGLLVSVLIVVAGGVLNLLVPAIFSVAGSLILLVYTSKIWKLDQVPVQSKKEQRHDVSSYRQILNNRYILFIISLSIVTMVAFYFVDISFINETRSQFPRQEDLAVFLGYFEAFASMATLITGMFLARPVIARYGVAGGLLALPLVSGVGAAAIILAFSANQSTLVIFILVALTRLMFNSTRATMHVPSYRVLIYPLLQGEQERTHTLIEVIVEPAVAGIIGFILLKLDIQVAIFFRIILALVFIWMMIVFFLNRLYAVALKRALGLRVLGGKEFSLEDNESKKIVKKGLDSPYAGEVIYVLDLLERSKSGKQDINDSLIDLLQHPAREVRKNVIDRIEKMELVEALPALKQLLEKEKCGEVRAAGLRTVSLLGGENGVIYVQQLVETGDWEEKEEAIVGQLRSGEIEGVLWGGSELLKLEKSENAEERIHAARILGKARIDNFYRPVKRLLADEDRRVRAEAVKAAGNLNNSHLWEVLICMLNDTGMRELVAASLANGGEDVIDIIDRVIRNGGTNRDDLMRMLRVCGRIKSDRAIGVIIRFLESDDLELTYQAVVALRQCGYQATGADHEKIRYMIRENVKRSAWLLAILLDIDKEETAQLLCRGLEQRLQGYIEIIFSLLMFIYDADSLWNAWNILSSFHWSQERRVYALETVDAIISSEHKELVLPLLEDISHSERLKKLAAIFPQKELQPIQRLQEVALSPDHEWSTWLKACSIQALAELNSDVYRYLMEDIRTRMDNQALHELEKYMSLVDKVRQIEQVSLFSEVPDEILVELAYKLVEVSVKAGESLFHKGDAGNSMYVILEGRVLVHDGSVHIAFRSEMDVIGEMAVLDMQPRSADVTAVEDSKFLRLDQDTFFDILADRVEVTRAVFKMLTRRLNENSSKNSDGYRR